MNINSISNYNNLHSGNKVNNEKNNTPNYYNKINESDTVSFKRKVPRESEFEELIKFFFVKWLLNM